MKRETMTTSDTQWFEVGPGRRIFCEVRGQGSPVVFFPGNGCSQGDIGPLGDAICQDYRLIGIDPPGREPTAWPDEPFDFIRDLVSLTGRIVGRLVEDPYVVIGHSMGGMLALQHARAAASAVRGLVLLEGFVTLPIHFRVVGRDGSRPIRMAPAIEAAWHERRRLNAAWGASHPTFVKTFWDSQQSHDARDWVAALNIPILVFIGDMGQPMPAAGDLDAWRLHLGMQGVADLEVQIVPRAGHWMMLDDPVAVQAPVMRFLERCLRRT